MKAKAILVAFLVALAHLIATAMSWTRWDAVGLQGPPPGWVRVIFTILSFPIVMAARPWANARPIGGVIFVFPASMLVNSLLWGIVAAILWSRRANARHRQVA